MVLVYYPTIRGEDIKDHVRKSIKNFIHENIDVHSKRISAEFPGDGVKCISKLQSHCENMTFYENIIYDRLFKQVTHKRGG